MAEERASHIVGFDPAQRPAETGDPAPIEPRRLPSFYSILFERPEDRVAEDALQEPRFFADLNCDQIVNAVTVGKEEYNLKPFFYVCLQRLDAIYYRQDVMRDLERPRLYECVTSFAGKMREVRGHLVRGRKLHYQEQKQAWFLDAVDIYCNAVNSLAAELAASDARSRGLLAFRDYLDAYVSSVAFNALLSVARPLKAGLAEIEYCVLIKGDRFTVRKYEGETDYSAEVEETFEKFKQGAVNDYRVKFPAHPEMNHLEAKILEFVGKLHPDLFAQLDAFCRRNSDFMDRTVVAFDREVQFYIAFLQYAAVLKRAGLQFCYPTLSTTSKDVCNYDGFDLALAHKLVGSSATVVCNDFHLTGQERVLIVSGPNQGGKTTFARAIGQLHYLASLGCPVPGREARLLLFDQLFTHFEKEENVENLRGKLEDDLVRMHGILGQATARSIIIMNEVFTSTTLQDETFLSEKILERIIELDLICVWVTFVDDLASFGPQTVSMTSTVVADNPALRTFKVVRRPADGLAHAMAIAQKHELTYDAIMRRIAP